MALLSRSEVVPRLVTVQCDMCCPPAVATTRDDLLREAGWTLAADGGAHDVCPRCAPDPVLRRSPRAERYAGTPVGRLPNLVVIGAAKAGTTSLHAHLASHPQIAMSEPKELQFFQDPDGAQWLGHYSTHFGSGTTVVGESSTMYTRAPVLPGVAERMAATVPEARLVYLVRDPVERALASYQEERFQLLDTRPATEAFADLDDPYHPYLAGSRYAAQLRGFAAHYPWERILVLSLTELREQPDTALRRVFAFLGVEEGHAVDTSVRHNEATAKFEYTGLGHRLRNSVAATAVRRLPPGARDRVRTAIRRTLSRPMERPEVSAELRQRLAEQLAPDAAEFRAMTGMAVPDWSV